MTEDFFCLFWLTNPSAPQYCGAAPLSGSKKVPLCQERGWGEVVSPLTGGVPRSGEGVVYNKEDYFHLTFVFNILQLNCYGIFIFLTADRNVIIDTRITIFVAYHMNKSCVMIIQDFVNIFVIDGGLVFHQSRILHTIIFRSIIFWDQRYWLCEGLPQI